jgi:hypothetical protein
MILGTEARVRPLVELVERGTGSDLSEQVTWPLVDSDEETYEVASESM